MRIKKYGDDKMTFIFAAAVILTAVYTISYAVFEAKNKHYLSCAATTAVCICEIALSVVMLVVK